MTNRERLAMHANNPMCASCHNLIDPIGFGFEKFDAIGMRREKHKLLFYPNLTRRGGAARAAEGDRAGYWTRRARSPDCRIRNSPTPRARRAPGARARSARNASSSRYFRYMAGRHGDAGRPAG